MNLAETCRHVGELTKWTLSDIELRARLLREAGIMPKGGYGRHAPDINPEDAAKLLIGLAVSAKAAHCPESVTSYSPMKPIDAFMAAPTFGEALSRILADHAYKLKVKRVIICKLWREASIEWTSGGKLKRATYRAEDLPKTGYGFAVREDTTFSGGFLHQLAIDLAEDDDAMGAILAENADK